MLWDALGCSGMLFNSSILICDPLQLAGRFFGMLWDALGCSGMLWDALGCSSILRDWFAIPCGWLEESLGCSGILPVFPVHERKRIRNESRFLCQLRILKIRSHWRPFFVCFYFRLRLLRLSLRLLRLLLPIKPFFLGGTPNYAGIKN